MTLQRAAFATHPPRPQVYYPSVPPFCRLLGALVGIYVVYCVLQGRVIVSWGPGARTFLRQENPGWFWTSVGIYSLLVLMLLFVF